MSITQPNADTQKLFSAWQAGDIAAAEQLVRRYQSELLRVARLLTDDEDVLSLAAGACAELFRTSFDDENLDVRTALLNILIDNYVDQDRPVTVDEQPGADRLPAISERHQVDDERSRTIQALALLDRETRAALIRLDFCFLQDSRSYFSVNESQLQSGRRRIRDAAGLHQDQPLHGVFSRLASDASQCEIWPAIADSVRAIQQRRRRRSHALTFGAIGLVIVATLAGILWLSDVQVFSTASGSASDPLAAAESDATRSSSTARAYPDLIPEAGRALSSSPATAPPVGIPAAGTVPDIQLLTGLEQGGTPSRTGTFSYDPATNSISELVDYGSDGVMSPDGAWMVFTYQESQTTARLSAVSTADMQLAWTAETALPKAAAIQQNVLYIVEPVRADGFQIHGFDLPTGAEVVRWPVEVNDVSLSGSDTLRLFSDPDEPVLYLLAERTDRANGLWTRVLLAYSVPGGELIDNRAHSTGSVNGQLDADFNLADARLTPDGSVLYALTRIDQGAHWAIRFLDVRSSQAGEGKQVPSDWGQPVTLQLPFVPAGDPHVDDVNIVFSNSGERLYLISLAEGEVAIVNVINQRLEAVFPIDSGAFKSPDYTRDFRRASYFESQLSVDGKRLYVTMFWEKNESVRSYPAQSSVWTIDTSTWQIVDRWTVAGHIRSLVLSGDGATLTVRSSASSGQAIISQFDTVSGQKIRTQRNFDLPDWVDIFRLSSLASIYHQEYGRSPVVGDVESRDNQIYKVLPGVVIGAGDSPALTGSPISVEIRLVHPVTSEPLHAAADGIRFDAAATLSVALTHPGADSVVLVPLRRSAGVYRGSVQLDAEGLWDALVTVTNPDGSSWNRDIPQALDVQAALLAENDKSYRLRIRPADAVTRRTVTIRAWWVDTETSAPLPDGVDFVAGVPETLDATFTAANGATSAAEFTRYPDGSYLGWTRFQQPGVWSPVISFKQPADNIPVTFQLDPLDVRDLTAIYRTTSAQPQAGDNGWNRGS